MIAPEAFFGIETNRIRNAVDGAFYIGIVIETWLITTNVVCENNVFYANWRIGSLGNLESIAAVFMEY